MAEKGKAVLQRLRSLDDLPDEQVAYAISLLEPRKGLAVIRAAVQILVDNPSLDARSGLLKVYEYFAEHEGVRDPGTYTRSLVLKALRPVCRADDMSLLTKAATTYEFPPPEFQENAALLRSAALVTITDLDDRQARYHATRLLADKHTDPMSGEPALMALRVLDALREDLPIYFYVTQPVEHMLPEVASECLRSLTNLPTSLLPHLIDTLSEVGSPLVKVGLFDLLIQHRSGPQNIDYLASFLQSADDLDMHHYLATTMIASGDATLRHLLVEVARYEQTPAKVGNILEAFQLLAGNPEIDDVIEMMAKRLDDPKSVRRRR